MTKIEYVGIKAHGRKDTVAGTGVVWLFQGDVQDVPDAAVPALIKHTDVWRVAEQAAGGLADAAPSQEPNTEPSADIDLDALDDDGLKAVIDRLGLKVDKRKKGDALRAAVAAAATSQAGA